MDHLEVITYEVFKISIPLEMLQSALSLADVGQNYKMTLAHTYLRFFYFKSNLFTFQIFIFIKDRDTVKYFHICGQVCFVISL